MVRLREVWAHPWQRRGLIALIVITLYGATGFGLVPWLLERTLTSTLAERLSLDTQVGDVQLNPFSLSLKVDDLAIAEADGERLISFERLFVNFQLSSLFRWAWSFDEIHLIKPSVHFERTSDTENNFATLATRWAASAAETGTAEPSPEPDAEATALPRLVIADLRIIDGQLSVLDQAAGEPFSTELAPIDLELEGFSTLPDKSGRQQVTIRTESGAELALTGSLSVNPLVLAGAVRLEGTYTPMLFRYFRDELALPVSFDGGALAASLDYRVAVDDDNEISVLLSNITGTLSGLNVNQPEHPHLVELQTMSMSGGSLSWPGKEARIESLVLDDLLLRLFRAADGSYLPGLEGANEAGAAIAPGEPSPTEEGLENVAEDAESWRISVVETAVNRARIIHTDTSLENGSLEISALDVTLANFTLEDDQQMPLTINLGVEPGGSLNLDGSLQLFPEVRLTSSLTVSRLALAAAQPYLNTVANIAIDNGSLSLEGEVSVTDETPFLYQGGLRIDELTLIDRAQEEALFSWAALVVDQLTLTPEELELSILAIDQPYARIEIERDGSNNIERTFVANDTVDRDGDGDGEAEPVTGGFAVTIGETRLTSGRTDFTDLALPLPFRAEVSNLEGEFSTFATGSSAPSRIDLTGQVNEYGQLGVEGSISAADPTADTDITVDFDNVNLPRMSPYTIKFAGRAIADGRTDLTLSYRIEEGTLDGSNRLVIRDLTLGEKVDQEGAMDLPLDMAVALLKDGEGNLDFSFPVTGAIDDPEFSYSGAVGTAFSNVIGGLVAAPFRLLGSLVGLTPDELEHIGFEPGDATITPPQRETLSKLAEALNQRPQLILEVAPVRNLSADSAAIAERLVDAEVDAFIAGSGAQDDGPSHTDALRAALESLHDSQAGTPTREELIAASSVDDGSGNMQLDVPAYNSALRQTLIEAREVSELDLNTLALSRLDAIQEALAALVTEESNRLRALPMADAELNEDGLVEMSLNVTIED